MRNLPTGLAAKITAPGQQPELSVTVQDLVERLQLFAQADWTAGRSAALLSTTGKILRARLGATGTGSLVVQRITPTSPSDWTAPGITLSTGANAEAGAALAQTAGTTRCFYLRAADNTIVYRDSTDDGQTWGAETAVLANPEPFCSGIAAASTTDLWITTYTYPLNTNTIRRSTFTAGAWPAWSTQGPTSPAYTQIRGLAVSPGSPDVFIAGAALRGFSSGISAASFTFDGSAYSPLSYVQQLDTPSAGLACSWPDVSQSGGTYYAAVTLTDDGSVSTTAHTRTTIYTSTDGFTWTPQLSAGSALAYGAHVIVAGGLTYIFDAVTCYLAPATPAPIDITDDVLALEIAERYNQPSTLALHLSNDHAQYTGAAWLVDNATITVSLGYSGQTVQTHIFHLDDWNLISSATEQTLSIAARDYLKLMDYPSTQLRVWSNKAIPQILLDLAQQARVSIDLAPATPQFFQPIGCFVIHPGETWLSALNRLANVFGFGFKSNGGTQVILFDPLITDPIDWSYGTEILAASKGQEADAANVIRVTGAPTDTAPAWAETTDPADILATGIEKYRNVVDRILTSSAQCAIRAGQELRAEQRTRVHAQLLVALNPSHQLADVITVTDSGCGMSGERYRISAMTWVASPGHQQWEHHLTLEAP